MSDWRPKVVDLWALVAVAEIVAEVLTNKLFGIQPSVIFQSHG